MNQILKVVLMLGLGGGLVGLAMDSQVGKEQEALQQSLTDAQSRVKTLSRDLETVRQRRIKLQGEVGTILDLEKQNGENLSSIPQEEAKTKELLEKWTAVEADRVAAVQAVRENEKKAAPRGMMLKDGSKLEQFVLRNISEDDTLTAEHSNGLKKLSRDQVTPDYATRLGLGWKPVPPTAPELKPQDQVSISVAAQAAAKKISPEETAELKKMEGKTASEKLAKVEEQLGKVMAFLEDAKQEMRALDIRKSESVVKGSTKTYGDLKKANADRISDLARQVTTLQGQRRGLQQQIKGLKTDGY